MESEPLFTLHGPDGHVWKLFENGRAEGFPEGTRITNRAALVLALLRSQEVNVEGALLSGDHDDSVV